MNIFLQSLSLSSFGWIVILQCHMVSKILAVDEDTGSLPHPHTRSHTSRTSTLSLSCWMHNICNEIMFLVCWISMWLPPNLLISIAVMTGGKWLYVRGLSILPWAKLHSPEMYASLSHTRTHMHTSKLKPTHYGFQLLIWWLFFHVSHPVASQSSGCQPWTIPTEISNWPSSTSGH